ncbi:hypothetical protein DPX16_21122 [Anabarilius grahami]|uniref:Uncharacterized protein n=1 Tax=Anabarilius grahami TaxID=495550 RepID=A0A3N0Z3W5_ANAGA|nr:hypothetical protein DPX16_21122 [Anabarilius grahami]
MELDTGQLLSDGDCVTGTAWVHHRTPHDSSYRPHTMALRTPAPSDRLSEDVKCPQTGVSTEDGGPQQILGMVQCHGRDPPSLLLPSDSIKDTLKVMLQRSNQQTFC